MKKLVITAEGAAYVDLTPEEIAERQAEEAAHTPDPSAVLKAHAAAKRFQVETGGITVSGQRVLTDRMSQNLINGAMVLASIDTGTPIDFKSATGWVQIDAATMTAIGVAVGRHVRGSFVTERAVSDGIDAGTITTTAQIDAAAWPSNG
jgi:hypothetical protein